MHIDKDREKFLVQFVSISKTPPNLPSALFLLESSLCTASHQDHTSYSPLRNWPDRRLNAIKT